MLLVSQGQIGVVWEPPKSYAFSEIRENWILECFNSVSFTPFIPHSLQIHIAHCTCVIWLLNAFTEYLATDRAAHLQTLSICLYRAAFWPDCLRTKFCSLLSRNLQWSDCMVQRASSVSNAPATLHEIRRISWNPRFQEHFMGIRHVSLS